MDRSVHKQKLPVDIKLQNLFVLHTKSLDSPFSEGIIFILYVNSLFLIWPSFVCANAGLALPLFDTSVIICNLKLT